MRFRYLPRVEQLVLPDNPTEYKLIQEFKEFLKQRSFKTSSDVSEGQLNLGTDDRLGFVDLEYRRDPRRPTSRRSNPMTG